LAIGLSIVNHRADRGCTTASPARARRVAAVEEAVDRGSNACRRWEVQQKHSLACFVVPATGIAGYGWGLIICPTTGLDKSVALNAVGRLVGRELFLQIRAAASARLSHLLENASASAE
jgi:hypothetical protein